MAEGRGQGGRLPGEGGSGAAAADARRLPTPAAASAPPGADRCPRAPAAPSPSPWQPPSSRIPASPTLGSLFFLSPGAPAGAERAGCGRCAGRAASPASSAGTTAIFCRIRLGWCRLPSAVGAPSPSVSRRGRAAGARARSHIPAGSGQSAAEQPRIPSAVPSQQGTAVLPPPNAPAPPAPVPLQSPARSRSTHPLPQPHCADPAPPVPPTPPPAFPGRPAPVPPLARSPGKDGRGQRRAWCRWPGLREAAGCGESRARWQRAPAGSHCRLVVCTPASPHPTPRRL